MTDRSTGPQIEGLRFIEHLGSGGYSDVYLYEQRRPKMRVAVKVLTRLSEAELNQFAAEAETMAELADHPFIVQVFRTGTTEDGRPYLVMKYYPPPNLGTRAASERLTVAEVLRTGVKLSSAVETAHRAGILHRDIKPANVLVSPYGEPGLADFGIAGKADNTDGDEYLGVSIRWSAPEVLSRDSNGSVATDVYSLGATLWHLLAGRSPFEVPSGDNSERALMGRILRSAPRSTGRGDVPASLERLLQQTMSSDPRVRPKSALEFALLLQDVEHELRYGRTTVVVDGDTNPRPEVASAPPGPATESPHTPTVSWSPPLTASPPSEPATTRRPVRVSGPEQVADQPITQRPTRPAPSVPPPSFEGPPSLESSLATDDPPPTTRRPMVATPDPIPLPPAVRRPPKAWVGIGVGVSMLSIVVAIVLLQSGSSSNRTHSSDATNQPTGSDQGGFRDGSVAAPTVTANYDSGSHILVFHWTVPGARAGQAYTYFIDGAALTGATTKTSASVNTSDPTNTCIVVGSVGNDGVSHLADKVCG